VPFLPGSTTIMLAQRTPERLEDMLVFDQRADGAAELAEQCVVELVLAVQPNQLFDELLDSRALGLLETEFAGVSGVEGDPQEDVTGIGIVPFLFGTREPTDRTMYADTQRLRLAFPHSPVLILQCSSIHRFLPLYSAWHAKRAKLA